MPLGRVNLDEMAELEEELKRGDRNYWKPNTGKNYIRIAPPWAEQITRIFHPAGYHYHVGGEDKTFPCPRLGEDRDDCFLCETGVELTKSDDPEEQEEGSELRASRKYLLNIIDLRNKEAGIQVWLCGIKAFKQIVAYFTDEQWGDITDPDEGYNLTVEKVGEGMNTEYNVRADKNASAWPKDFDYLLDDDQLPDLSVFHTFATNAEMEAALYSETTSTKRREEGRATQQAAPELPGEDPDADPEADPDDPDAGEPEPLAEPAPPMRARGGRSASPARAATPARATRSASAPAGRPAGRAAPRPSTRPPRQAAPDFPTEAPATADRRVRPATTAPAGTARRLGRRLAGS